MESDANTNYSEYRHQFSSTNNSQNNSGLLKYRSAPSFLLENFTDGVEKGERLTSRLFFHDANSMHELKSYNTCNSKGSVNSFAALNSQLSPQYPRQNATQLGSLAVDGGGYRVVNSMGMDHQGQGNNIGSNILRQNSTPAVLFSDLTQHGYASVRGTGSYRMTDCGSDGDLSPSSSSRLINRLKFSCGMPSSLGTLSRITEVENENIGVNNGPDDSKVGNGGADSLFYSSGFQFSSWNDSSNFAENFCSGIKRELDDDQKLFGHTQNTEPENRPHVLSSLPKTSSEIAAMEKLLQLQDTVPCKVRAKRGCATHPRSIAERVRRTRISERMRKLQELVPNMDKQTNTADMLDLAVEYIKNLQKQYKTLSDYRANCKCSASQKTAVLNQMPWKEE